MANSTTGSVWVIDTAAVLTTNPIKVKRISWTPAANGNGLSITANDGNTIWSHTAVTAEAGIPVDGPFEISCAGINVATIDAGTLFIHF